MNGLQSEIKKANILFAVFVFLLISLFALTALRNMSDRPRYVLLSFDIEPVDTDQDVLEVLDIVYRNNISATFFVTGEYAAEHQQIVGFMTGGEIGCHGYTHKRFTQMKRSEMLTDLKMCREALKNVTGKDPAGFRAPYNLVNRETLQAVQDSGFTYDASMVSGWKIIYPSISGLDLGEIPVSSLFGIPLEDVAWLYYLRLPSTYFYLLEHKTSGMESYLFHPHHIAQHKNEFEALISALKKGNAIFISHSQLIDTHEGV
ncbi:polysaccharide deacetylase family protein [Candidatus Woesearchaeota archaeon]|nr:polysaccharide deacetylase family protein [Candidatus Woesearchaeota archaeon]